MHAFWLSLIMVFIAELGDKTQLVALTMATRFKAGVVLAGVFVATLIVHLISVGLGGLAGELLPGDWITFIIFGLWTLRGDSLDEERDSRRGTASPFMIVTVTFFLAELGDKTMLSTVTLAATHPVFPVWLGSTAGMVLSDGLAIVVGQILGARLPERIIKISAACIFIAFGLPSAIQGAIKLPTAAWALAVVALGVVSFIFFRRPAPKALVEAEDSAG
jgi:putative Ca2+/H+ antiporter (TMEM165/GDT1 family)